jgi:hypothetical protein
MKTTKKKKLLAKIWPISEAELAHIVAIQNAEERHLAMRLYVVMQQMKHQEAHLPGRKQDFKAESEVYVAVESIRAQTDCTVNEACFQLAEQRTGTLRSKFRGRPERTLYKAYKRYRDRVKNFRPRS